MKVSGETVIENICYAARRRQKSASAELFCGEIRQSRAFDAMAKVPRKAVPA